MEVDLLKVGAAISGFASGVIGFTPTYLRSRLEVFAMNPRELIDHLRNVRIPNLRDTVLAAAGLVLAARIAVQIYEGSLDAAITPQAVEAVKYFLVFSEIGVFVTGFLLGGQCRRTIAIEEQALRRPDVQPSVQLPSGD